MSIWGSVRYPTITSACSTIRSVRLACRSRHTPNGTEPIRLRAVSIRADSASKTDRVTIEPCRESTRPSRWGVRLSCPSSRSTRRSKVSSVTGPAGSAHPARRGIGSAPSSPSRSTAPANSVLVPTRDRWASKSDRMVKSSQTVGLGLNVLVSWTSDTTPIRGTATLFRASIFQV